MASPASEIDPAAEPHIVVEESSSSGGGEGEAPPEAEVAEVVVDREAVEGEAKEEEGECGFCVYMKGGGCKETFVSWEQCMQAAHEEDSDVVKLCSEATVNLVKCMVAHADYYAPVLEAEQTVNGQAEAAVTAAAADTDKNTGEEEAVVETAASAADAKEEVVEQAASSMAAEEAKKDVAVVEKVESLSLSN